MEFNEAFSQMKQLVNSYKAVKRLEEVLDYVAICKQREVELTVTIDKLQKETKTLEETKTSMLSDHSNMKTKLLADFETQRQKIESDISKLTEDHKELKDNLLREEEEMKARVVSLKSEYDRTMKAFREDREKEEKRLVDIKKEMESIKAKL